jgi:TolB-like protein/Flp pilus assembly protein TadD
MEALRVTPRAVRFGVFEFDLCSGELRKQGRKIRLEGQPVRVLMQLLEQPGEVVTREELQRALWPADTFVNFEYSLNAAVKRLRRALGDSPENPRFVETLVKRGYRFVAPVAPVGAGAGHAMRFLRSITSLAVLPFENADSGTEYLSDGIAESIINSLSQLPSVQVMARSTVFRYKDRNVNPRVAGRRLNVQAVLLGRVQQRGDRLLVGTELVEVETGWLLWGEQYNRRLSDILAVEQEISKEISEKLRLRLSGMDRSRLVKRYTDSSEAYQYYLMGRYHWTRVNEGGLRKGIEFFEKAIQSDQRYALAYAGLADSLALLAFFGLAPPGEVMPRAKEAAHTALGIDDQLAEAHASLAGILKVYDWNWPASERAYLRALELNPNYTVAHRGYAAYLSALGKAEQAMRQIRRAHELDPLSLTINMELAWNLYMAREYDQSIEQALRTLELDPEFHPTQHILGMAYEQRGKYAQACAAFQRAAAGAQQHPSPVAGRAHVLAIAGERGEAQRILEGLREAARQRYVSPYWPALICAGLGESEAAMEHLGRAYEQRDPWLVWLKTDPRLEVLHGEELFQSMLLRIGLAPGSGSAATG